METTTRIPNCCYCGKPLTLNEYDFESDGYFSAHSVCQSETPDGRFSVVELTSVFRPFAERHGGERVRRFTTAKRAEGDAEYLAQANTAFNGARWQVVDVETGETVYETPLVPSFVEGKGFVGEPIVAA